MALTKQSYRLVGYQLKFLILSEQPVKSETLWYFTFYYFYKEVRLVVRLKEPKMTKPVSIF